MSQQLAHVESSVSASFRFLALVLFFLLSSMFSERAMGGVTVFDFTISGTVSRPADSDLSNSLTVSVRVCDQFGQSCRFNTATIPAGQTTSNTFTSNDPGNNRFKRVAYSCSSCDAPLVGAGVYAAGESGNAVPLNRVNDTPPAGVVTTIDAQLVTTIDFTLASGTVFSGNLNFPEALANTESSIVTACTGTSDDLVCTDGVFDFAAGETQKPFALAVAPTDQQWEIQISCSGCRNDFYSLGFFADGRQNNVTVRRNAATRLSGDEPRDDLDMQFIEGVELSGSISLPGNLTATNDNQTQVNVCSASAEDFFGNDSCVRNSPVIGIGNNSATFQVVIAPELNWTLEADCFGPCVGLDNIFPQVFYAANQDNNSFWSREAATSIRLANDSDEFDLTFFAGTEFSGEVFTPNSEPLSRSFSYQIFAFDPQSGFGTVASEFMFDVSDSYTIDVPVVENLIVGAMPNVDSPNSMAEQFLPFAFHAVGAGAALSITDRTKAAQVPADEGPKTGINIGLSEGNLIGGSISTIDGNDPDNDLFIHMIVDQQSGNGVNLGGFFGEELGGYGGYGDGTGTGFGEQRGTGGYLFGPPNAGLVNYEPIRISEQGGSGRRSFSVRISPDADTSWRTYYGCLNCGGEFERYGFFKENPSLPEFDADPSETTAISGQATFVSGGADYSGHDLFLLEQEVPLCVAIKTANNKVATVCL